MAEVNATQLGTARPKKVKVQLENAATTHTLAGRGVGAEREHRHHRHHGESKESLAAAHLEQEEPTSEDEEDTDDKDSKNVTNNQGETATAREAVRMHRR